MGSGAALRSSSQACLHVHRTFITETDKTASAILPTTLSGLCRMHGATAWAWHEPLTPERSCLDLDRQWCCHAGLVA